MTYFCSWNPVSRPDPREKQITRNLANHIANCPAGLHVIELIAIQPKILFHPRYERIVDVDLIEVLDEITYFRNRSISLRLIESDAKIIPNDAKVKMAESSLKSSWRSSGDLSNVSQI